MERYFTFRYEPFEETTDDEHMMAMLKDNKVYDFIPNIKSWVNVEVIQESFFMNDPHAEFTEITESKAYEIALGMRPYNPIVVDIILADAKKDGILPLNLT